MKKKIIASVICTFMAFSILIGCGQKDNTDLKDTQENEIQSNDEKPEGLNETSTEIESEQIAMTKVSVSDWGYQSISYISDEYLLAYDGEKYFLIDYDGNPVSEDKFNFEKDGDGFDIKWDSVYTDLQGGAFSAIVLNEGGTYSNCLFDNELKALIIGRDLGCYFADYRDDIVEAIFPEGVEYPNGAYAFLTIDSTQITSMEIADGNYKVVSPMSYGFSTIMYSTYVAKGKDGVEIGNTNWLKKITSTGETNHSYIYDDYKIVPMYNSVNKDGWLYAVLGVKVGKKFSAGIDADGNKLDGGFYNINTGEFVVVPNSMGCDFVREENGCGTCTVIDHWAVISVEKDADGNITAYKVFDLSTGEYSSDNRYKRVFLAHEDKILVQSLDDKWGYLDSSDMSECSDWYDDATQFCGDYAMVNIDGQEFVINKDMQIVSEAVVGESAAAAQDYYEFSDIGNKSVFFVKKGDLYYTATVTE